MCTVNSNSIDEARHVLDALGVLRDSAVTLRRATQAEAEAWLATATQPRCKMRRLRKKNPGTTNAPGQQDYKENVAVV
jgi:hypothetical protein